jgi:sortase A
MSVSARSVVRFIEWPAWIGGVTLLVWALATLTVSIWYQHKTSAELDARLAVVRSAVPAVTPSVAPVAPAPPSPIAVGIGDPIGRLEIPRLGLSVMVANGDDDQTLTVAAGHLPDTPFPWEPGNTAIAAHRDSYFRPLKAIRANDDLRLTTPNGTFRYRVTQLSIVTPDDLSVLRETAVPSLTLITCYPFTYVGHAPKRFIVRAERIEAPTS